MNCGKSLGFTLIEMVMVMVILAILAASTGQMISHPVKSYISLESRTRLTDSAETALRRMQRDLRRALPNSVRITGGGKVIEILHVLEGGRYRASKDNTLSPTAGLCAVNPRFDELDFASPDSCFEFMGNFSSFNPQATAGESLVIYNVNNEAYAGTNRTTVVNSGHPRLVRFAAFKFPLSSPPQRFYIVDTPVTYRCDMATGQLLRYSGYAIASSQPNPPAGVTGQLQVNQVSACNFSYAASAQTRSGLITVALTLTDNSGESVRLMHQIHVDNAP